MELKKISKEELREKLELHKKWLKGGKEGIKLDLRNTDLRHADLRNADLNYADLKGANLKYANLKHTNLSYSNLSNTDLRHSNLSYSILYEADLTYSHLEGTNLRYSDLSCADLSRLDLSNIDLSKTKFYLTKLYKTKGNFVGVENIGSRNDTTHYFYNEDRIICGCFNGTMEEFENKVKETYKESSKEYKQYIIAIDTLKRLAKLGDEK